MEKQSQVQEKFMEFFEQWIQQLETNLQQLLTVTRDSSHEIVHKALVSNVMNLYKEYYTTKWASAHEDILGFFSQPWLTPLESAHVWITGWKPSMVYKLLNSLREGKLLSTVADLTEEQWKKIEVLKARTSQEEGKVERDMERQQVSLADKHTVKLAKLTNHVTGVELSGHVDVAMNTLLASLEKIMKTADCVRLKTLRGVLVVLTPIQSVDFLAAFLMINIQLRNLGKFREGCSHVV